MTERLKDVLARAEAVVIDPERAAEYERDQERTRQQELREQRAERIRREGISLRPHVMRALVSGGELEQTTSLRTVRRWLESTNVPTVLVLSGATGCGKTVAAAYALASSHAALWRSAGDVVRAFAGHFGEALEDQQLMASCALLVLDDVGSEHDAQRFEVAAVELLEKRKQGAERMRTLITTNLTKDELFARYPNPRFRSRMIELAHWKIDAGADMRVAWSKP